MDPKNAFRYILRYKIAPGYAVDDRIDELIKFCHDSKTEEVMLFYTAEELSPGHPTDDELNTYNDLALKVRKALNAEGIDMSINPWSTTYHTGDRGRTLREDQDFTLMVGETGTENRVTACPLCEKWQNWICRTFAEMAQKVQPTVIWVEDDWRLHNHGPQMNFGGCFCKLHLERFSQMIGQKVTRQQVIENICAPGKPHPWREKWLDLSRETMIEPAEKLKNAVHSANPSTRLALMSSVPDVHSAEGRDWNALAKSLDDSQTFMIRPHLSPYTEERPHIHYPSFARMTIANLNSDLEIYPELEDSPRSGQYSKSCKYDVWECLNSAMFGSKGITINHYDMLGTGITLDTELEGYLSAAKTQLNEILSLNIDDRNSIGPKVLFSPDLARHISSTDKNSLFGLVGKSYEWSKVLSILGLSHKFSINIENDDPIMVSGQTLSAFDDDFISKLLTKIVFLDAHSVEILIQRGFGQQIGISSANWISLEDTGYSYEQILSEDKEIYKISQPRMTAQRCADFILDMSAVNKDDAKSLIFTGNEKQLCPGMITHNNQSGGRIFSLTYPLMGQKQFYMGFFNVYRKFLIQNALFKSEYNKQLAAVTSHIAFLYANKTENALVLGVLNPSYDVIKKAKLKVSKSLIADYSKFTLITKDGRKTANIETQQQNDFVDIEILEDIPSLEAAILVAE